MTTLNDLNGYLDDEAYTVRVGELRALLSASIADTAPRAHAIDCEYIQDDNPWARCTCGVGGPNDGRKSIADTAGAKPQTDAEALYGAWQSTIAYMYEQHAAPPAPSVADSDRRKELTTALGLPTDGIRDGKKVSFAWDYLIALVRDLAGSSSVADAAGASEGQAVYQVQDPCEGTWEDTDWLTYKSTDGAFARALYTHPSAELTALRERIAELEREQLAWRKFTDEANATMDKADARIAGMEKDAERYRFLEHQCRTGTYRGIISRDAIDAAMKEPKQ